MPGNVDLAYLVRRAAASFPHAPGVRDDKVALDIATLVAQAERFANALDGLGLAPGSRIAILSENRSEYVIADLAILLARQVRVALNARLAEEDHSRVIADAGVRLLIHSGAFAEVADALRRRHGLIAVSFDAPAADSLDFTDLLVRASARPAKRPGAIEDPAWITYTAGTTGAPKGVVLSRRAIREVAFNLLLELGPVAPGSRILLPQALSHGGGYFILPWLLSGGGIHVLANFDPEQIFDIGDAAGPQLLKCVPAMLPALLEISERRRLGFGSIVYGASPISRPVLEAALARFGPILTQIYGQSEAPATITCLRAADHLGDGEQRFSAGRPWPTAAVEIQDAEGNSLPAGEAGEVVVTGPHLMTGYHGLPELTGEVLREGWIRTRDRGLLDERGFLHLRGRMDEMIDSGGYNISPREVEDVLCRFPCAEEVSVIGVPDARWGTAVAAVVKLKAGAVGTSEDVIAFARPLLGFRSPKHVRIVAAIPKTSYGKVDRLRLTALLADRDVEAAS